jgi:hypothetical protein
LFGAAVKVTFVPAQIAPGGLADMLTLTGWLALTFMVMGAEVAGLPEMQDVELEVMMQITTSPVASVEEA